MSTPKKENEKTSDPVLQSSGEVLKEVVKEKLKPFFVFTEQLYVFYSGAILWQDQGKDNKVNGILSSKGAYFISLLLN